MPRNSRYGRKGTIYVITLSTTFIVAVLATSTLTMVRVQRKYSDETNEARQAMLYAESALQIAKSRISTDSQWRTKFASNTWASDQAIGDGYYSFIASDPVDGNLTNLAYDPVLVTATGRKGSTIQKLQGKVTIEQPGISCLACGIHAEKDLSIRDITLNSSFAPVSSDTKVKVEGNAKVYADVESKGNVDLSGGAQIFGTSSPNLSLKQNPSNSQVLNYYTTNGTTIPMASLPLWDRNYLTNPGAESGVVGWAAQNCSVTQISTVKKSGDYAFQVSGRALLPLVNPSFIYQDITSVIAQNVNYAFEAHVYVNNLLDVDSFRIHVRINATGGNVDYTSSWVLGEHAKWKKVTGSNSFTWSGTLQSAYWYVESQLLGAPFVLDDCVMKESGARTNVRVIHRTLLSPQQNPFTGVLNANGIYVIDCAGDEVNIRDSRIEGTLVLRQPASSSAVEGSVCLNPYIEKEMSPNVPNLLGMIMDKKMSISLSATNLSESIANCNFNPTGSPYGGAVDGDKGDVYPSQLGGVIYSFEDLTLGGNTTINGVLLCKEKIDVIGTGYSTSSVTVNHNPIYYHANPPLNFCDSPVVGLLPSSVTKVVE